MAAAPPIVYDLPGLWGETPRPHTAAEWDNARRAELLDLFASQVYGRTPGGGGVSDVRVTSRDETAFDRLATMSQLAVTFGGPRGTRTASLLLYTPNAASASSPAPCFLGLNFKGNHATTRDPAIAASHGWMRAPAGRGEEERCWPVRIALERGYAVATMHYCEIEGDAPGLAAAGVRGLFSSEAELARSHAPDAWGAIGAWAWGLSRLLDVLMTIPEIDGSAVLVHGHSRLGKTALWAAAQDPRFAAAISNNSGCGGASLFRHVSGETIPMITEVFPHWFAGNFNAYREALDFLRVDQHHLLALLAPRPVHVASATLDAHADPRGEFLSTLYASPVFELFGHSGALPVGGRRAGEDISCADAARLETPSPGRRVGGRLSYHMREGVHDVLAEDWRHFLDFADANVLSALGRP